MFISSKIREKDKKHSLIAPIRLKLSKDNKSENSPLGLLSDEEKIGDLIQLIKRNNQSSDQYIENLKGEYKAGEKRESEEDTELFDVMPLLEMMGEDIILLTKEYNRVPLSDSKKKYLEEKIIAVITELPKKFRAKYGSLSVVSYAKKYAELKKEFEERVLDTTLKLRQEFLMDIERKQASPDSKMIENKFPSTLYNYLLKQFQNEIFYQLNFLQRQYKTEEIFTVNNNLTESAYFNICGIKELSPKCFEEFKELFKQKFVLKKDKDRDVYSYNCTVSIKFEYNFKYITDISLQDIDHYVYHLCQANHFLINQLLLRASRNALINAFSDFPESQAHKAALRCEQIAISILKYKKDFPLAVYEEIFHLATRADNKKLIQAISNNKLLLEVPRRLHYPAISGATFWKTALSKDRVLLKLNPFSNKTCFLQLK